MTPRGIAIASSTGLVLAAAIAALVLLLPAGNAAMTALPAGNLVKNPGGEVPLGGEINTEQVPPALWQSDAPTGSANGGLQVVRYGDHQFILSRPFSAVIGGGRNFIAGGYATNNSVGYQAIDVSRAAPEIDAGGVKACFSAFLGGGIENAGVANATARATLQFFGEDGSTLAQLVLGPVTKGHRKNGKTLLWRASERATPNGTRSLKVSLYLDGFFSNGAFADNVTVALTKGRCIPQLAVRCAKGALVATVVASDAIRTQRVRFQVRGKKGRKLVNDARAPFTARVPMTGLTGALTVAATLTQPAGSGNVTLTKKSRRC